MASISDSQYIMLAITDAEIEMFETFRKDVGRPDIPIIATVPFLRAHDNAISIFNYFMKDSDLNACPINPISLPIKEDYPISCCANGAAWIYSSDENRLRAGHIDVDPDTLGIDSVRYYSASDMYTDHRRMITDVYDEHGRKLFRDLHDPTGKKILIRTYFDPTGKEILVENYASANITLNADGIQKTFYGRSHFALYVLKKLGLKNKPVIFHSIYSTTEYICNNDQKNILLWPNLNTNKPSELERALLDHQKFGCSCMITRPDQKIETDIPTYPAGRIFEFKRENRMTGTALIYATNHTAKTMLSVVKSLPMLKFHVIFSDQDNTDDSEPLIEFRSHPNVTLHQIDSCSQIPDEIIRRYLLQDCDIAILTDPSLISIETDLFLNNTLLFSLCNCMYLWDHVLPENQYPSRSVSSLIAKLMFLYTVISPEKIKRLIEKQQNNSGNCPPGLLLNIKNNILPT